MKIETGLEKKKIIEATPPSPPLQIPGLLTPHPPRISNPFCGGGMDIFWNYTIVQWSNVSIIFLAC